MPTPQDESRATVRALFIECASLHRDGIPDAERVAIEAELRSDVERILEALAFFIAAGDESKRWTVSPDAPGYILRQFGDVQVRVPLHLFDDIPDDAVFEELLALATAIRTDGAVICLSGSSAVHGTLQQIGDCDFCEYLGGEAPDNFRTAGDAVAAVSSRAIVPLALTGWGEQSWKVRRPWQVPVVNDDVLAITRTMMGHYFGMTDFAGALEVTKLMIPLSPHAFDKRDSSHPAQELPLDTPGGWVPRSLIEPREIGGYVAFLREQVLKYRQDNLAKSVKRAFSLARVLFFDDVADEILRMIRETSLLLRAAAGARVQFAMRLRREYGDELGDDVHQRALATAVALFQQCSTHNGDQLVSPDAIAEALAALPAEDSAPIIRFLERFVRSVDEEIEQALH